MVTVERVAECFHIPVSQVVCEYCDNYSNKFCNLWGTASNDDDVCGQYWPKSKRR